MDASIVIPTRNKSAFLDFTLESLYHQSYSKRLYEVIVIDDGSNDDTDTTLSNFAMRDWNFKYESHPHQGRSVARNKGLRLSEGRVIIFVDDDTICRKDFIATHLAHYFDDVQKAVVAARREVFSRLVGVRSSLSLLAKSAMYELDWFTTGLYGERILQDALPDSLDLITRNDIVSNQSRIHALSVIRLKTRPAALRRVTLGDFSCPWTLFITSNASVRRDAVMNAGGFDEEFHGWGEEDVELGFRLYLNGVKFEAAPDAVVYHQIHPVDHSIDRTWLYNYIHFAEKYDSPEIYLRWQPLYGNMTLNQYEEILKKIQIGSLKETELNKIKSEYLDFIKLCESMGGPELIDAWLIQP